MGTNVKYTRIDNNLSNNAHIDLVLPNNAKSVLLVGNTIGMFGFYKTYVDVDGTTKVAIDDRRSDTIGNLSDRIAYVSEKLSQGCLFVVLGDKSVNEYYQMFAEFVYQDNETFVNKKRWFESHFLFWDVDNCKCETLTKVLRMFHLKKWNYTFDCIIANPEYNKTFYLDFLARCLDIVNQKSGHMEIIGSAHTYLTLCPHARIRTYGACDYVYETMIGKHIEKVVIRNMNDAFGMHFRSAISITYIDFTKEYDKFEFYCCGDVPTMVDDYRDCNLVGDHHIIESILKKASKSPFGVMNGKCINKYKKTPYAADIRFLRYEYTRMDSLGTRSIKSMDDVRIDTHQCGTYWEPYIRSCASDKPFHIYDKRPLGKSGKVCDAIYGSTQELENWYHYVHTNKLPLFINICLIFDGNNNSRKYIPWLVDKHYSDDEIYELLGIDEQERNFIDKTLEKYEVNSEWFKRYVSGKDDLQYGGRNKKANVWNKVYDLTNDEHPFQTICELLKCVKDDCSLLITEEEWHSADICHNDCSTMMRGHVRKIIKTTYDDKDVLLFNISPTTTIDTFDYYDNGQIRKMTY